MLEIDHLLWTVPELTSGIDFLENLTGIRAMPGGSHPGRGTHNALAGLGEGSYLELLSTDPAQDLDQITGDGLGPVIRHRSLPGLFTYAMRCPDMTRLERAAKKMGLEFRGPRRISRAQPNGETLSWYLCHTDQSRFGRCLPFYIDWRDTRHPSTVAPSGLNLTCFEVIHPESRELQTIYDALEIGVIVRTGDRPGMRAVIESASGELVLTSLS